jgi:hypothetical protein
VKHIFVSFSGDDNELAQYLTKVFNHLFSGYAKFFTSSVGLDPGSLWLDRIRQEVVLADTVLILLSPRTFNRPWINVEAGAFW